MYRQNFPDDPGMHNTDSHTRTHYRRNPTFLERVGNSLFGILIGIALLISASGLLFWNEGRAVQTSKSLEEGLGVVHHLNTIDVAFEENSGKLVYLSGQLKTELLLQDQLYDVSASAVKLKRQVQMYQWVEEEHSRPLEIDEGSHTRDEITYSYSQQWRSELISSSSFDNPVGHHNPSEFAVDTKEYVAENAKVGAFQLSEGLVGKINEYKDLPATVEPLQPGVKLYMGYYYHGNNPLVPQIGDLKVKFSYAGATGDSTESIAKPDTVSIVAKQKHSKLESYETNAGDFLELLYYGQLSPKEIFGREHAQNTFLSWAIRFGGWLLMFVGFGCVTRIIAVLVDWLPIVRELVSMGMHMMNLIMSISLSLTVIAVGWIRYRPLLGCTILVMAAAPFLLSRFRFRQNGGSHRNV